MQLSLPVQRWLRIHGVCRESVCDRHGSHRTQSEDSGREHPQSTAPTPGTSDSVWRATSPQHHASRWHTTVSWAGDNPHRLASLWLSEREGQWWYPCSGSVAESARSGDPADYYYCRQPQTPEVPPNQLELPAQANTQSCITMGNAYTYKHAKLVTLITPIWCIVWVEIEGHKFWKKSCQFASLDCATQFSILLMY